MCEPYVPGPVTVIMAKALTWYILIGLIVCTVQLGHRVYTCKEFFPKDFNLLQKFGTGIFLVTLLATAWPIFLVVAFIGWRLKVNLNRLERMNSKPLKPQKARASV